MRRLLALPALATATATPPPQAVPVAQAPAAQAQTAQSATLATAPDDRRLGHLPYADVGAAALVSAPEGFALGQPCRVQPTVAAALAQLIAAKAASGVAGELRGLSCYRSVAHQRSVFCRKDRACVENESRARLVAPPGYSEHESGYAVDFAVRPAPGCRDVSPCIASTEAGRWLIANGPRFGFELSFPSGNRQGVGWEPWHWRWVGLDGEEPTAHAARGVFATARARFPAFPAVAPLVVRVAEQPPVPLAAIAKPAPAPVVDLPKRRRRYGLFGHR